MTSIFTYKRFANTSRMHLWLKESCQTIKITDNWWIFKAEITKPYRIFITCPIYHVHCFFSSPIFFHFCKIGTGYDPSSKLFLSRTKISIEGNIKYEEDFSRPEKSVENLVANWRNLLETSSKLPAISCKLQINHSSWNMQIAHIAASWSNLPTCRRSTQT